MGKTTLIPFDAADFLGSEDDIALYLSSVMEDGSAQEIAAALGDIARARGMSKIALDAGLSRESLYKGLSGDRAPTADTMLKVIRALGLRLAVHPV